MSGLSCAHTGSIRQNGSVIVYIRLIQPGMIKRPMDTDLKLHMAPPYAMQTAARFRPNGRFTDFVCRCITCRHMGRIGELPARYM